MKDKAMCAIGVVIGLVACIPLWFVRVIGLVLVILWFVLTYIRLGIRKLESLLYMALTGEEQEGHVLDEMIYALKTLKRSLHK
jgi:hypothetical protein